MPLSLQDVERVKHEQEVLKDGFQSEFWRILTKSIELRDADMLKAMDDSNLTLEQLRKIQGARQELKWLLSIPKSHPYNKS